MRYIRGHTEVDEATDVRWMVVKMDLGGGLYVWVSDRGFVFPLGAGPEVPPAERRGALSIADLFRSRS